jgi:FkbM family methyltransferase
MSHLVPCTRYGPLEVPGGSDLISRFVAEFGEWSYFETAFVASLLAPGARILDAGAFVGTFALGLSCRRPAGLVAVEANAELLPLLRANFSRLAPAGYGIEHGILGDGSPMQAPPLLTVPENLGSLSFVAQAGTPPAGNWDAMPPLLTLPALRQRHGDFDLIKLDIEGAELAALRADAAWLAARRPTLWVECNEQPGVFALYEFIAGLGYDVHYLAYPSHNPHNFLGNREPIFPLAYEAGLVATQPGSPPALEEPLVAAGCDLIRVADAEHLRACLWITPRWGLAEWVGMPRSRLLALVSRLYRQQSFDEFMPRG